MKRQLTFSNEDGLNLFEELDVWILNYFAYGVENSTYMREFPKGKFKAVKAFTPDDEYLKNVSMKPVDLKTRVEIDSYNEGGSGVYSSLLDQFKDGKDANGVEHEYLWGGSFILDVKTGELYCWDYYEGLARKNVWWRWSRIKTSASLK